MEEHWHPESKSYVLGDAPQRSNNSDKNRTPVTRSEAKNTQVELETWPKRKPSLMDQGFCSLSWEGAKL